MYVKSLKSGKRIKFCSCGTVIGAVTKRKSTCGDSRCNEKVSVDLERKYVR